MGRENLELGIENLELVILEEIAAALGLAMTGEG
jgi:hypothetical protein